VAPQVPIRVRVELEDADPALTPISTPGSSMPARPAPRQAAGARHPESPTLDVPRRHHRRATRALYRGPHGLELTGGLIEAVIAMHVNHNRPAIRTRH
jgi:hypothetical protein